MMAGNGAVSPGVLARAGLASWRALAWRPAALAAGVLLAFAVLAPASTQAQTRTVTYISNVNKSQRPGHAIGQRDRAQTFRTGSRSGGYPFQDVVLRFQRAGSASLTVTIRGNSVVSGGSPTNIPSDSILYTLTNPTSLVSGLNTFTAPANATLAADTIYHIVVEAESSDGASTTWRRVLRNDVDAGGSDGWRISFPYLSRLGGGRWDSGSSDAYMAQVRGEGPVLPTVAVTAGTTPVEEGAGAQFTVTRTVITTGELTVNYDVSETGDMVASRNEGAKRVVFSDGDTAKTVTVSTVEDAVHEADSTVTLMLARDEEAYDLGTATADVTVEDDDNAAPTGEVTVGDTMPVVGETLTADTSGIDDGDGLTGATFAYQWIRVGTGGTERPIPEATKASYTVVSDDVGATLKVAVSYTDDDGTDERIESATTSPVLPTVTLILAPDTITEAGGASTVTARLDRALGVLTTMEISVMPVAPAVVGDYTLSSDRVLTIPAGQTTSTGEVTITARDNSVHAPDKFLTVSATAQPEGGVYEVNGPDAVTLTIEDDDNAPPTGAPTIANTTPVVGDTLTADTSGIDDADGLTGVAFAYQWIRVSGETTTPISGATASTYTVVAEDVGAALKVAVSFTDDDGTAETLESTETAAAEEAPLPVVTVEPVATPVAEGRDAQFTVRRTEVTAGALTVNYDVSETGDMVASSEEGAKSVAFADGETEQTVTVLTVGDSADETNSEVTVTLTADDAYDLGADATATVTVEDDDYGVPVGNRLVSNTAKADGDEAAIGGGPVSQPFTTGNAADGYDLASVVVAIDEPGSNVRVTIRENDEVGGIDNPGAVLYTLANPPVEVGDGLYEYRAPAHARLERGAAYHIVAERTDSVVRDWKEAAGTGADSGSARNWIISQSHRIRLGTRWIISSGSLKIQVRGSEADPLPEISIDDESVAEGDAGETTDLEFTVELDKASPQVVTVDWETRDNQTADYVTDFIEASGSLTFNVGETGKTLTVTVVGDDVDEPHETFRVVLSNLSSGAAVGDGGATGTIIDDENVLPTGAPTVDDTTPMVGDTLTADASGIGDTDGLEGATFAWRWFRVADGAETEVGTGETYTVVAADVGATLKVEVTYTDDGGAAETVVSEATAAVPMVPLPKVTLVLTPATITEGGTSTLTATLSRASSEDTTVTVNTVPASPHPLEFTIPAGQTESRGEGVEFATEDNDVDEPARTLTLAGTAANDEGVTDPDPVTLTVEDNDDAPTVTLHLDPASISENSGLSTVTASLDHASSEETTVAVTVTAVSPAAAGDFTLSDNRELTIPAGETQSDGRVTITGVDNAEEAPDKTVRVSATARNTQGITAPDAVSLTIRNDDGDVLPALSIADASVDEGDTGTVTLDFTVTLDRTATQTVTVDWETSAGTAAAGTDYTSGSGTLTFDVGDSSKTVSVTVAGDNVDEPNETFTVTLSDESGAVIEDGEAMGTIADDDATPTVTLSLAPDTIGEAGGVSWVTASLDRPSSEETTLTLTLTPVPPAVPGDYAGLGALRLRIPAGETLSLGDGVSITAVNNDVHEGDKTVTVSAAAANRLGITAPQNVTLTITEDETPPPRLPELSIGDAVVVEGDTGSATLEFTVMLNETAPATVTVDWATFDGTATAGADYTAGMGTLTFSSGETEKTVSVPVLGDHVDEPNETFTVRLSDVSSGAIIGEGTGTGTIEDDDATPTVTLRLSPASIGEAGGTSTVTARLDRASSAATRVTVTVTAVSPATADDYVLSGSELTIAAGRTESTGEVTIAAVDNELDDATRRVRVSGTATNAQGITGPSSVTLAITDDDASSVLSIGDATVVEGDTGSAGMTFTVTLTPPARRTVTVEWATASGTATAGTDYTSASGALTFAVGDSSKQVTVLVLGDEEDEPDETFRVELTNAVGAEIEDNSGAGTVLDDDLPVVTAAAEAATVPEGGEAVFVLARMGQVADELTVVFRVEDASGVLVGASPVEATFGSGAETARVALATVDDESDAPDATLSLTLVAGDGYELGAMSQASVAVLDDDLPVVTVAAEAATVPEGEAAVFVLARMGQAADELTVAFRVEDAGGVLVGASPVEATFGSGAAAVRVVLATVDDEADAPDATLRLTLAAGDGYALGAVSQASVTVLDDDLPVVTVMAEAATVLEGGEAVFVLARMGQVSDELTVAFRVEDAGGVLVGASPVEATFGSGAAAVRVVLATVDDEADAADATLSLTLAAGDGYDLGAVSEAVVTVLDDDLPVVTVSSEAATVLEGGEAVFVLARQGQVADELTVVLRVEDAGGVLVGAAPVEATFGSGAATARVVLATVDDEADAADATLRLTLAAGDGYALGAVSEASVTVLDDDLPVVAVSAEAASVVEGGEAVFVLARQGQVGDELTVALRVEDAGGVLVGASPVEATFGSGAAAVRVVLATVDDEADAPDATLRLTLAAGDGYALGAVSEATVTVLDDDLPVVTVMAEAATVLEGGEAVFVLARQGQVADELTVALRVEDAGGVLVGALPVEATFGAGAATARVALATVDDESDAPDATLRLTLEAGDGYELGAMSQASVAVLDDDLPVVTVAAEAAAVAEGGEAVFVLARMGQVADELTVALRVEDGGGVLVGASPVEATFGAGAATARVALATVDDESDAPDATLRLTLEAGDGYELGAQSEATVTVLDDDLPVVTVMAEAATVLEGGEAVFVLARQGQVADELTVALRVEDAGGVLVGALPVEATFGAGAATARVALATVDDESDAPDATLSLTLVAGDGYELGAQSEAVVTVLDDDLPVVTVAAEAATVAEGGEAVFVLARMGQVSDELTVALRVEDAGGVLVGALPVEATFGSGAETVRVALATVDDESDAPDATLSLTLVAGDGYELGAQSEAVVTVLDDDLPVVTVAAEAATVAEGEAAVFVLTRMGDVAGELTVELDVSEQGADMVPAAAEGMRDAAFEAGATTVLLRVATDDDGVPEPDSQVTVAIATGGGAYEVGRPGFATVTVEDAGGASVLIPGRRAGASALLRRHVERFSQLTSDRVLRRLDGNRRVSAVEVGVDEGEDAATDAGTATDAEAVTDSRTAGDRSSVRRSRSTSPPDTGYDDERGTAVGAAEAAAAAAAGVATDAFGAAAAARDPLSAHRRRGASTVGIAVDAAGGAASSAEAAAAAVPATDVLAPTAGGQTAGDPPPFQWNRGGWLADPTAATAAHDPLSLLRSGRLPMVDVGADGGWFTMRGDVAVNLPSLHIGHAGSAVEGGQAGSTDPFEGNRALPMAALEGNRALPMTALEGNREAPGASLGLHQGGVAASGDVRMDVPLPFGARSVSRLDVSVREDGEVRALGDLRVDLPLVSEAGEASTLDVRFSEYGVAADGDVRVDLPLGWEGWSSLRYTKLHDVDDGSVWDFHAGADYLDGSGRTVYGFLVGYEPGRVTSEGVRLETEHVQLGVYGARRLTETLIVDGAVGWGHGEGDLSLVGDPLAVAASYDSRRMVVRGGLTGGFGWSGENWRIEPQVDVVHMREDLGAFTDDIGGVAPADELWLTRLGIGPRLTWKRENSVTHARLRMNLDDQNLGALEALEREWTAGLELGHGWQVNERISVDLSASFDGLGSDLYSSSSLGLTFQGSF